MGGTFDPIHHGHLVAASEVADLFDLDEVVFVPTGQPWQKADREVSPAEHRYLMTVVATASNPRFWVSRVDIDRPGPDLHGGHGARHRRDPARRRAVLHHRRGRAAGDPVLEGRRRGVPHVPPDRRHPARLPPSAATTCRSDIVTLLDVPAMAISSSAVRERVLADRPIWYLVPDGVVQYIGKHGSTGSQPRTATAARRDGYRTAQLAGRRSELAGPRPELAGRPGQPEDELVGVAAVRVGQSARPAALGDEAGREAARAEATLSTLQPSSSRAIGVWLKVQSTSSRSARVVKRRPRNSGSTP